MNTIDDMQNEKNFYDHYNEFEYNHDFVIFLWKIDDTLLGYVVLYEKDYYKVSLFWVNNFTIWKIFTIYDLNSLRVISDFFVSFIQILILVFHYGHFLFLNRNLFLMWHEINVFFTISISVFKIVITIFRTIFFNFVICLKTG